MEYVIVLWEPRIPQNVGNIARLSAATGSVLHLVGQLGFVLSNRHLARAGLDYWPKVKFEHFPDTLAYFEFLKQKDFVLFSTKAKTSYWDKKFEENQYLVFGAEDRGLPDYILRSYYSRAYFLPMNFNDVRSLNLSNSVAIVLYEAMRQNRFDLK